MQTLLGYLAGELLSHSISSVKAIEKWNADISATSDQKKEIEAQRPFNELMMPCLEDLVVPGSSHSELPRNESSML